MTEHKQDVEHLVQAVVAAGGGLTVHPGVGSKGNGRLLKMSGELMGLL